MNAAEHTKTLLESLGISASKTPGVPSPIDGSAMPAVAATSAQDLEATIAASTAAFAQWRVIPAPNRGELVRRYGVLLREHKKTLGQIITLEMGKSLTEGEAEVQEMIDICDFAVGLSRQLYGLTIASERPQHHMREMWHPLGPVGIISAFNFPMAVWAWNAMLALVCGDPVLWKPSEKTPLCAVAANHLLEKVRAEMFPEIPGLSAVVHGDAQIGRALSQDPRLPLISATGSVPMGRAVAQTVAQRLGRSLLELGGNAASIIAPSANLDMALRAVVFGAVGTSGQRCTSLRRLMIHDSIYDSFVARLKSAYASLVIGDPRETKSHLGPLIDKAAVTQMQAVLEQARKGGATVWGGEPLEGCYVKPALVETAPGNPLLSQETFAPILYVMRYSDFDTALGVLCDVPQGLSSSVLTNDLTEAERFLSASGSDCGIANINMGPSGAEIGGAFGGEKETGGGRESGSDAWKAYMRRQTQTINYGRSLPLAQGIAFDL